MMGRIPRPKAYHGLYGHRSASLSLLVALFIIFLVAVHPAYAQAPTPSWTVTDNTVWMDTEDYYLSVTPATLASSGWVEVEVKSKGYAGPLDLLIGTAGANELTATSAEWYTSFPQPEYECVDVELDGMLDINDIDIAADTTGETPVVIGKEKPGNKKAKVRLEDGEKAIVSYTSKVKLDNKKTRYLYKYDDKVRQTKWVDKPGWKPQTDNITRVKTDYAGASTWQQASTGVDIGDEVTHRFRVWVELPFSGAQRVQGKYNIAMKPSTMTLDKAIETGSLWLLDPWYDTGWRYRQKITADNTKVDADLTDFPVLITEANINAHLWSNCRADGGDIVITTLADVVLPRELVSIDTGAHTLELYFKADLANTTDTEFYLYYGNPGATEVNSTAVWSNGYKSVYHLPDLTNTTVTDSTANGLTGGKKGIGEPAEVNAYIGKGQDFDNTDDYIANGAVSTYSYAQNTGVFTVSAWIKLDDYTQTLKANPIIANTPAASAQKGIFFAYDNRVGIGYDNQLRLVLVNGTGVVVINSASAINAITDNNWHYVAATGDGTNVRFIIDGVSQVGSGVIGVLSAGDSTNIMRLGNSYGVSSLAGLMDEVRIATDTKSTTWLSTTYNNLSSPGTFYSVGAVEGEPQPPTLTLSADGNNLVLAWTKGLYANNTTIVRGQYQHPLSRNDGVTIYTTDGVTYIELGIRSAVENYYYSAWGKSEWGYSETYSTVAYEQPATPAIPEDTTASDFLKQLILVGVLFAVAAWRRHPYLCIICVPVAITFGFAWAGYYMVEGIIVACLGIYFAYTAIAELARR